MKFSTRADIDAPIQHVFAEVSDFSSFERSAMRRGARVRRVDAQDVRGPGMGWEADFAFRGKTRQIRIDLEDYEDPTHMAFTGKTQGLNGFFDVELIALSPKKTRMRIALDLKPQTLSARLLVQSLKLAKGSVMKKFEARVAEFSKDIAGRYRQTA